MTRPRGAAIVLGIALALLGGSIAWAVDSAQGDSWFGHGYAYGPSMMGLGYSTTKAAPVTSIAQARERARAFADRLGLRTSEILRFQLNYDVVLVDKEGNGATEVLVDPATGAVSLEYGPAMMWNTRYGPSGRDRGGMTSAAEMRSMMGSYGVAYGGMMGAGMMGGSGDGMMGGSSTPPAATGGAVSLARAHAIARRWLDANEPGTTVESGGDAFPGYYTLETLSDGRIDGMISVNAATGAVWPHWWHGRFVARSA